MKWLALIPIIMFLTIAPARTAVADDPGPGSGGGGSGGSTWPKGEPLVGDHCVEDVDGATSRRPDDGIRSCQSRTPTRRNGGESPISIHAPFVTGLGFDVTGLRWFIGISTHP